jgi:hypothetical protein
LAVWESDAFAKGGLQNACLQGLRRGCSLRKTRGQPACGGQGKRTERTRLQEIAPRRPPSRSTLGLILTHELTSVSHSAG